MRKWLLILKEEELHGIVTDFKYSIENYANVFCKRASQKLYTLERVSAFVTSQFEYLHVVLDVFYCRNLNNKILPLHKWVLEETITQFQIIIEIGRPYGKKRVNENQHSVIFTQCGSEPISFLGPKIWDMSQVTLSGVNHSMVLKQRLQKGFQKDSYVVCAKCTFAKRN